MYSIVNNIHQSPGGGDRRQKSPVNPTFAISAKIALVSNANDFSKNCPTIKCRQPDISPLRPNSYTVNVFIDDKKLC